MKTPTKKEQPSLSLLEKRLAKAQEEKKNLTAEKREIREKLTAAEKKVRATELKRKADQESLAGNLSRVEKQLKEAEKNALAQAEQVTALLAENRRLAEGLDASLADAEKLREVALKSSEEAKTAKAESVAALKAKEKIEVDFRKSEAERKSLQNRLTAAEEQLKAKKITPILQSEEVAKLFGELIDNIRGGLGGVSVRSGEIKLKVAFSAAGNLRGFVVPTPQAGSEIKDNLHEITIRFDQPLVTGVKTPLVSPIIETPAAVPSRARSTRARAAKKKQG